jgi:hypothetical protein
MRWTDSDNLKSRDALIVDGPQAGLLIPVAEKRTGEFRHPDVTDLSGYVFNAQDWTFQLQD